MTEQMIPAPDLFAESDQEDHVNSPSPAQEAGWWLLRERELVGARVEDVVAATRIDPKYIIALEEGRLEDLPDRNQTLDIVWAYADFLLLEPGPLCGHYGKLLPQEAPKRTLEIQQTQFKGIGIMSRFLTPRISVDPMIAGACATMVLLGTFVWMVIPGSDHSSDAQLAKVPAIEVPNVDEIVTGSIPKQKKQTGLPVAHKVSDIKVGETGEQSYEQSGLTELIKRTVTESAKKQEAPTTQKVAALKPTPEAKVEAPVKSAPVGQVYGRANAKSRLFIQAENRVYVRIEDDGGTVIFNQTLNAGDGFKVPNRKGLVLVARDGGALRYVVDGKRSGKLGESGEILVGRSLDIDKLGSKG